MKRIYIYDLEVFWNIFTATFIDKDSDDVRVFVIYKDRDDRQALFKFLDTEVQGLIGYNCNTYDYQILHYLRTHKGCSTKQLRTYSDRITSVNQSMMDVPEHMFTIPHLDLFHALSLSVKAKRTSLKWCEYQMDFPNIEDMPEVKDEEDFLDSVCRYNKNDVLATKALYHNYYYEIELRKTLTELENVNLVNSTEPNMAKKIFAKHLSEAMGISIQELKQLGTDRDDVDFNEIILPYIKFDTPVLQGVLNRFKQEKYSTFESFNTSWGGLTHNFGVGGLHSFGSSGIYKSDEEYIIKTVDFRSYYPNLIIRNGFCPEHLPKDPFLPLYEGYYNKRISIPKKDPQNYILKILLNSAYGLLNDKFSFLRDVRVMTQVTINGQLTLLMLAEKLSKLGQLLMLNSDGLEIKIHRDNEAEFLQICKEFEKLTNLELEHDEYEFIVARDINSYLSKFTNGYTKCKGAFEFENIPLHKNKSFSIIPRAVFNYFIHDIPVEDTIYNHKNIYDFCGGIRARSSDKRGAARFELYSIKDGKVTNTKLSKTVRYFISKKGGTLYKLYANGTREHVEAPLKKGRQIRDWKVTIFNRYYESDDYGLDMQFYIHKSKELINSITIPNQLQLL